MASPTHLYVFVDENDDIFASPNTDHAPTIPDLKTRFWAEGDPIDCLKIKFDQDEYPYMGYVPLNLRCKGLIFERLDLSQYPALIEPVPGKARWRTVPDIAAQWSRLEEALIMMSSMVYDKAAEYYVPLDYKLPPFPKTYGYLRDHAASRFALKSVRRSRSAFLPLIAWLACACASAGDLGSSTPRWYKILEKSGRVHQEWLNEMARNEIADFSGKVKRVGLFVHLGRCPWLTRVDVYIKTKVPIWFYWGNTKHGYVKNYDKWVQRYKPPPSLIQEAVRKRDRRLQEAVREPQRPLGTERIERPESQDNSRPVEAEDLAPPKSQFPPPIKGSGQRLGEHWRDFFTRLEETQHRVAKNETLKLSQARLDRERRQARHPFPGKKGPACWRWELIGGFRIRTPVTRGEVEQIWDTIPNEHRRYNSFDNVWDINPEFDPNVDEEYFSDNDTPERYPSPLPLPPTTSNPAAIAVPEPADLHSQHHADSNRELLRSLNIQPLSGLSALIYDDLLKTVGNTVRETTVDVECMEDTLCYRYGFISTRLVNTSAMPSEPMAWMVVRNIVGDCRATPSKSFCEAAAYFVTCMLNPEEERSKKTLRELCDLYRELRDACAQTSPIIRIRTIRFADKVIRYLLEPPIHSDCYVVLDSALSAVECMRRAEYKPEEIVSRLVRQGIPFRTIITGPPPQARPRPPPFYFGLGYCQQNYKPTTVDYTAYERARDDFLRGPRGRAALMKGGIVWRLAMQSLHQDVVIAGPSESVYQSGVSFVDDVLGKYWWDDDLTQDEMNLICGVYKVFTGIGLQVSDMSWWPKHSAWERSGADFGYWSAKSEEWFQKRLTEIRDGKQGLRTAGTWSNALSFHRKTRRFLDANEKLAAEYLAGYPVF